jgi:hypothetical protein
MTAAVDLNLDEKIHAEFDVRFGFAIGVNFIFCTGVS